jgi:hypothetical protein
MRRYELILFLVAFAGTAFEGSAQAATKVFIHDAASPQGTLSTASAGYGCVNGTNDNVWRLANSSQGASAVSMTFKPTVTAPPCQTQTASGSGQYLMWLSPSISSAVTVSGNINYQAYCKESQNGSNFGFRFVVKRWSAAIGGMDATVQTSAASTECSTGGGVIAIAAAAPTSTSFAVGDRIAIYVELVQASGTPTWGGNSTRTFTLIYDGTSGANGDTFANFTESISFSADANSGHAIVH